MGKKIYLIDTENVGSVWKHVLPELNEDTSLLMFYTEHSPGISYMDMKEVIACGHEFSMIQCYTGKNGLDFQLVTYLGYLIKSDPLKEYVIISNDYGFDNVANFWKDRGCKVSRLTSAALLRKAKEQTEKVQKLGAGTGRIQGEITDIAARELKEYMTEDDIMLQSTVETESTTEAVAVEPEVILEPAAEITPEIEESVTVETIPTEEIKTKKTRKTRKKVEPVDTVMTQEPEMVQSEPEPPKKVSGKKTTAKKTASKKKTQGKETEEMPFSDVPEDLISNDIPALDTDEKVEKETSPVPADMAQAEEVIRQKLGDTYQELDLSALIQVFSKYPMERLQSIHGQIVKAYGQKNGLAIYHALKPYISEIYTAMPYKEVPEDVHPDELTDAELVTLFA